MIVRAYKENDLDAMIQIWDNPKNCVNLRSGVE